MTAQLIDGDAGGQFGLIGLTRLSTIYLASRTGHRSVVGAYLAHVRVRRRSPHFVKADGRIDKPTTATFATSETYALWRTGRRCAEITSSRGAIELRPRASTLPWIGGAECDSIRETVRQDRIRSGRAPEADWQRPAGRRTG